MEGEREIMRGGSDMRYEKPNIEVLTFNNLDIITLSVEDSGSGDDYDGPW